MLDAILDGLDETTARSLKRLAWRQGLALSDFVRQVLKSYVNSYGTRESEAAYIKAASHVPVRSCDAQKN